MIQQKIEKSKESKNSDVKESAVLKSEEGDIKTKKRKIFKAKKIRKILKGQAHIQSTYNNTIVTITDLNGNVIVWGSAGTAGFKGAKKSTPYAATSIVRSLLEKTKDSGLREVEVFLKGIGSGRDAAVRALQSGGLDVTSIKDVTPVPHNGCRPPKIRRI